MGIFSCYIVNAVILVSKNVMAGNDSREELPRWLLGRPKSVGERGRVKVKHREQGAEKGKIALTIWNKIDS